MRRTDSRWLVQQALSAATLSGAIRTLLTMSSAPAHLSKTFKESALAERQKLIALYQVSREQHERYLNQAGNAALDAERYLRTIRELGELLGVEDQLSLVELLPELRGERLREIAAEIVFRHFQPGEEFHYRQWFDLVVAEGHRVGGKNPAATFLTQIARVEGIERIGRRTGLYRRAA